MSESLSELIDRWLDLRDELKFERARDGSYRRISEIENEIDEIREKIDQWRKHG